MFFRCDVLIVQYIWYIAAKEHLFLSNSTICTVYFISDYPQNILSYFNCRWKISYQKKILCFT